MTYWLGALGAAQAQPSPQKAGGDAALAEAEKRNFGTSEEDVEAYGQAAGAAAGVAACCAAGGVGCAAAPACGLIGGEIGGAIAKAVYDIFSGDEATGIASNQAKDWKEVWGSGERRDAFRMFALGCVEELRRTKIQFTDPNLKAQDAVLAPAMPALRQWPWKNGVPPPKSGEAWSSWVGRVGDWVKSAASYGGMNLWATMQTATRQFQAAMVASAGDVVGEQAAAKAKASQAPAASTGGETVVKVAAGAGALYLVAKVVGWL